MSKETSENLNVDMAQAFKDYLDLRDKTALLSNMIFIQPEEIKKNLPWGKLKLNGTQMNILETLSDGLSLQNGETSITIGEISKMEGLHKQAVTKPVAELVKAGLVRKFKKDGNLKSVYVELTDYGRQLCDEQHDILHTYLKQKIFSTVSLKELKSMTNLLTSHYDFLLRFVSRENNLMH